MADRIDDLDYAERWFADAFRVIDVPGGVGLLEVDMSRARALVGQLRAAGVAATYNHLVVRAVALTLARRPELHHLVAGSQRLHPSRVDVGMSVSSEGSTFAPVMVIEDAASKRLPELSAEIVRRVPEVRAKQQRDLAFVRRWGRLVPFGWLRRLILRWLFSRVAFRRQLVGTFQISCLPTLDVALLLTTTAAGSLGVGGVRERVIAVDGRPEVRPVLTLAVAMDHKAWDGVMTVDFVQTVRRILESGELEAELPAEAAPGAAPVLGTAE